MTIEEIIARAIDPEAWNGELQQKNLWRERAKRQATRIVDALAAAGYAIVPPPEGTVS